VAVAAAVMALHTGLDLVAAVQQAVTFAFKAVRDSKIVAVVVE